MSPIGRTFGSRPPRTSSKTELSGLGLRRGYASSMRSRSLDVGPTWLRGSSGRVELASSPSLYRISGIPTFRVSPKPSSRPARPLTNSCWSARPAPRARCRRAHHPRRFLPCRGPRAVPLAGGSASSDIHPLWPPVHRGDRGRA